MVLLQFHGFGKRLKEGIEIERQRNATGHLRIAAYTLWDGLGIGNP